MAVLFVCIKKVIFIIFYVFQIVSSCYIWMNGILWVDLNEEILIISIIFNSYKKINVYKKIWKQYYLFEMFLNLCKKKQKLILREKKNKTILVFLNIFAYKVDCM